MARSNNITNLAPATRRLQVTARCMAAGAIAAVLCGSPLLIRQVAARDFPVSTPAAITAALTSAQPGDTLTMQNGLWPNADILFKGSGTAAAPITLRAQTPGQVWLTGNSRLRLAGSFLVVSGLLFTNGYVVSDHVIAFREDSATPANDCRVTGCAIINYNPPFSLWDSKWVSLYGRSNQVDHCEFSGKNNSGPTLVVWVSSQPNEPNYHRIEHNYFGPRPDLGVNGGETIRVGTSAVSLNRSGTVVAHNCFERCSGDVEIISNKSGENVYQHNTFIECEGALTLRHGNRCRVEANYFLGNNQPRTGGVRIIGEDHLVWNNYFAELTGSSARSALSLMQGLENSPLNGYFQVKRAAILFNTFVNCDHSLLIGLSDTLTGTLIETTLPPLDCVMGNNLVFTTRGNLVDQRITPINMLWEGNLMFGAALGIPPQSGITQTDPRLELAADGLWRPRADSPARGGAAGSYAAVTEDFEGQSRTVPKDVGADQESAAPVRFPRLTPAEVGPCWRRPQPAHPIINQQPGSQSIEAGATVAFAVRASGGGPLDYQWWFNGGPLTNGNNITGVHSNVLTLDRAQTNQAGTYIATVSNACGSAASVPAQLTVVPPRRRLLADCVNAASGTEVTVPISLAAVGDEIAVEFSLHFDPARLARPVVALGSNTPAAELSLNTDELSAGHLGVRLSLPAGNVLAAGTNQLVRVTFNVAPGLSNATAAIQLRDAPVAITATDAQTNHWPAAVADGCVVIHLAAAYEADVAPRPNGSGDGAITIADWVQTGRFIAGLDAVLGNEFQRADVAPRATRGNGALTIADWVQAGRYGAALDAVQAAGGPTGPAANFAGTGQWVPSPLTGAGLGDRCLRVTDATATAGTTQAVAVRLQAAGDENGIGFTLAFDPADLEFAGARLRGAMAEGTLLINAQFLKTGRLGVVMALPVGRTLPPGDQAIVQFDFHVVELASHLTTDLRLTDEVVLRQVATRDAQPAVTRYADGTMTIAAAPAAAALKLQHLAQLPDGTVRLLIGRRDQTAIDDAALDRIALYWTTNVTLPLAAWRRVTNALVRTNGLVQVDHPAAAPASSRFYRAVETP